VALLVRWHHERMDGSGYPDGLSGDQIPLAARVLCAADAYDAMTSDRPYRAGMTPEVAVAELRRCAGLDHDSSLLPTRDHRVRDHFDARVVRVLTSLILSGALGEDEGLSPRAQIAGSLWPQFSGGVQAQGAPPTRANCWEINGCGQERGVRKGCAVPFARELDGVNGGHNGGRVCWAHPGALCRHGEGEIAAVPERCMSCLVLARVRREEGLAAFVLIPGRPEPEVEPAEEGAQGA